MSDSPSQNDPRRAMPPMGVEESFEQDPRGAPARSPARHVARQPARHFTPPEAHEKYSIPRDQQDPAMDYFWMPTRVAGMPNDKVSQYYRAGWQPAVAADFPDQSGYGTEYPQKMIDLGLLKNVEADEPLILDDLMLVQRPKELSRAARERDKERAQDQVANQMRRLQQAYRPMRDGGVSRRHRPMADGAYSSEED